MLYCSFEGPFPGWDTCRGGVLCRESSQSGETEKQATAAGKTETVTGTGKIQIED